MHLKGMLLCWHLFTLWTKRRGRRLERSFLLHE